MDETTDPQTLAEQALFALVTRFRESTDPDETSRLGDELGRIVFGE